jgi:hypothetical protein
MLGVMEMPCDGKFGNEAMTGVDNVFFEMVWPM